MGGRGGGAAGAGGRGGAAGAGPYSCPLGGVLSCSAAGALDLEPGGEIANFSALEWGATPNKWCDVNGLDGGIFSYGGGPAPTDGGAASSGAVAVDPMARLVLNLTVAPTGYAGAGLSFDSCVDASGFNAIAFTASVTAGNLTNCVWQVQLQTQDQRPSNLTGPTGGTCNPDGGAGCYRFPAAPLTMPVAATYVVPFASFDNPASSPIATPTQVVGVQWQVNSAGGRCMVELRIDDIRFVTQ
jgi:hypothetical protein